MTTDADLLALVPAHQLTKEELHNRLMGWFVAETYRQRSNRQRMAKSEAYYDQYQYDARTKAAIEARGQYAIVFDRIAPQIDWLIGTERRTRIDYRVDAREAIDTEALTDGENKTKLLKYLDDTGDSVFHRSHAFGITCKAGLAWTEIGADMDNSGETPVFEVHLSWRDIVHDSFSMAMDPRLMRYIFRIKVVDLDIALAYFPKSKQELMRVQQDAADLDTMRPWISTPGSVLDLEALFGNAAADGLANEAYPMPNLFQGRRRVLLIEAWTMEPVRIGPDGRQGGLSDPIRMRPRVTIMTEFAILWEGWSPYAHNRFPFVPYWAYREAATGLPYSPVRRAMDKQDGLNGAMSRAHYEIATNQIVAEAGAFEPEGMGIDEVREEVDDPEGTIVLANGGLERFQIRRGFEKAEAHMAMAERYIAHLDEASAITREQRGADRAPISGIARQVKENQGSVVTAELFDNVLLAHKWSGEIKLSVVEQYVTKPLAVAVGDERGQKKILEVNQQNPDGTWRNDITARKGRFVIAEQPWRQSLAQGHFESLMELLTQLAPVMPQVVTALLDMVFEFADIPNKKSVLERIRAVTGQPGPDNQETPEQIEQKKKAAAIAQAEFEAKLAGLQAQVREAQGKGEKLNAEAMLKQLEALYTAAQAAQTVQMNPGVAPMADEILKSVGFQDKHPDQNLAANALPAPGQPPQPAGPGRAMQMPVDTAAASPEQLSPLAGHQAGIETVAPDGQPLEP